MSKRSATGALKARLNWITRLVDVVKLIKKGGPVAVNLYIAPQTWFDLALIANDEKTTIGGVISNILDGSGQLVERAKALRNHPK